MVTVTGVQPNSPAARKKVQAGDRLLKMNGHEIVDVLDYRFFLMETCLHIETERDGHRRIFCIHKDEYADIGLEFETYLMDKQRRCRNNCIFCFIDQLPTGMRETLYFKDDDSRLSFLFGNYITLTNLSERELERIIQMHISPVNVSVHTMNPELRCRMMGNRFAGEALKSLDRLTEAGIAVNVQLVLCPEINDGEELDFSMRELAARMPSVQSVAVVPVGLTKHRENLYPLRLFTPEEARTVIAQIESFGDELLRTTGNRLVYPADEWYLKAGYPIPEEPFYGEMSQLENGVGMTALLRAEFSRAMEQAEGTAKGDRLLLATGTAAAPILQELIDRAANKWHNLCVTVVPIVNHFFGETITVAGLVTGGDLIEQLRGRSADRLLIPRCMLRNEGDRFLDDVTLEQVERELGIPLTVVAEDGESLLNALLGIDKER